MQAKYVDEGNYISLTLRFNIHWLGDYVPLTFWNKKNANNLIMITHRSTINYYTKNIEQNRI